MNIINLRTKQNMERSKQKKINHKRYNYKLIKENNTVKNKRINSSLILKIYKKNAIFIEKLKNKSENYNNSKNLSAKLINNYNRIFVNNIEKKYSLNKSLNKYDSIKGPINKKNINDFMKKFNDNINNNMLLVINNKINEQNFILSNSKFKDKPQYNPQYIDDILITLLTEEEKYFLKELNEMLRIFSDEKRIQYIIFLMKACDILTNKQEVIYLSINIFDRVIAKLINKKNSLTPKELELILITSLFIAFKYETGNYFKINQFIEFLDNPLVTKEEVLQYEFEINKLLGYNYLLVYPSDFLIYYLLIDNNNNNSNIYYYSLYLINYVLLDLNLLCNKPSLISASCYYISKIRILNDANWAFNLQLISGYSRNEIIQFSFSILKSFKKVRNENKDIVNYLFEKYLNKDNNIIDNKAH